MRGGRGEILREGGVEKRPLDFRLLLRLFGYTKPYALKRNLLLCLVVTRAAQLPMLVWLMSAIISGPIAEGDLKTTLWGAGGYLILALLTGLVFRYRMRLGLEIGEAVVHDLRNEIFRHLLNMPMSFFHKTRLGRIISRLTSDVESLRIGVQDVLFVSLVNLGQMLIAGTLMLYCDWVLFCVILAMAPVIWLLNHHFRTRLGEAYRAVQESFSRVTSNLAESVGGIRVTQGFVRQDVNADIFRRITEDHSRINMTAARMSALFLPMLELNSQFFIALLLLIGGYRVLTPGLDMDTADLISFFFLTGMFFLPLQAVGRMYNQMLSAMAGAERVFHLLDTEPDWKDEPDAKDISHLRGEIEFQNVSFGYNPESLVLHDLNFTAKPNQVIALVGHTGSGKSSIINLISKFYLPTKGELLYDGVDIRKITSDSLHKQLGIVQQQTFLFSGSVLDNIRVGNPEATDEDIREAASRLGCLDLLESLPQGLQTHVGEGGSKLSLGQRQVVCFTRALIADPRILILDEATSSVDAMTEARLQIALSKLLKDRTSFIVAHRLSTIRSADLVLVLAGGKIIERGNHSQLMEKKGYYASMYRMFMSVQETAA